MRLLFQGCLQHDVFPDNLNHSFSADFSVIHYLSALAELSGLPLSATAVYQLRYFKTPCYPMTSVTPVIKIPAFNPYEFVQFVVSSSPVLRQLQHKVKPAIFNQRHEIKVSRPYF